VPIAFPQPKRGPAWTWPENLLSALALSLANGAKQYVPNLISQDPGAPQTLTVQGGAPLVKAAQQKNGNLRNLGSYYVDVTKTAVVNRENLPYTNELIYDRELALSPARSFIAITKNSANAVLPFATVYLLKQVNGQWQEQERTVSDAAGNFRFDVMSDGPYWIPGYKSGAPDVTGASVNTLQPT
jgi:hypothetical protein